MTTKDQERKALEQIRRIVEGLGEDSYIGTALEGCLEDAEENINNDWACSMKQRYLDATASYKTVVDLYKEEQKKTKELEKKVADLQKRTIPVTYASDIRNFLSCEKSDISRKVEMFAEEIVELAETPTDIGFKNAVSAHRDALQKVEKYNCLISKMDEIIRV